MENTCRQFTVCTRGTEITFTSAYTDEEAITKLSKQVPTSEFAKSLVKQSTERHLSPKQIAWVHKLVTDAEKQVMPPPRVMPPQVMPPPQVKEEELRIISRLVSDIFRNVIFAAIQREQEELAAQIPSFCDLVKRIEHAGTKIKNPKIVFKLDTSHTIEFSKRENNDFIRVSGHRFSGIISSDGKIRSKYGHMNLLTPEFVAILSDIATDSVGYAVKYGLGSGYCCFCSRPLSDERALAVGYGKVCANHYCLPWGHKRISIKDALCIT